MTNSDARAKGYADRIARLLETIRDAKEGIAHIKLEMKSGMDAYPMTKAEIKGVMLAAAWSIERDEEEAKRVEKEEMIVDAQALAARIRSLMHNTPEV